MIKVMTNTIVWILLALGALGGIGTVTNFFRTSGPDVNQVQTDTSGQTSLALKFAKVWLTLTPNETEEQRKKDLQPYVPNVDLIGWVPPEVAQVPTDLYVQKVNQLAPDFAVITVEVFADLSNKEKRHLTLNVPILRQENGSYAISGEPVLAPPPAVGKLEFELSSGKEAPSEIYQKAEPFLNDFLRAYLMSQNVNDLSNMVVDGSRLEPMGGFMEFQKINRKKIVEIGKEKYEAVLTVQVRDPITKAVLPEQFMVDFVKSESGQLTATEVWRH